MPWVYTLLKGNFVVPTGQKKFGLGGVWAHDLRIRSSNALHPEGVGSNPIGAKFFLTRGDSQISFKKDIWPISQKHACYFSACNLKHGFLKSRHILAQNVRNWTGNALILTPDALERWTEIRNARFSTPLGHLVRFPWKICLALWKPCKQQNRLFLWFLYLFLLSLWQEPVILT